MMGVADESVHRSSLGWTPVYASDNIGVISIGFLLESPDDAVIWRGPKKNGGFKTRGWMGGDIPRLFHAD